MTAVGKPGALAVDEAVADSDSEGADAESSKEPVDCFGPVATGAADFGVDGVGEAFGLFAAADGATTFDEAAGVTADFAAAGARVDETVGGDAGAIETETNAEEGFFAVVLGTFGLSVFPCGVFGPVFAVGGD